MRMRRRIYPSIAIVVCRVFLRKKLQGRRRGVEPNIEPSTDPEDLRDAPRMGSNNATRLTIQMREAYCAFFNEEGAVPWQPRA
ncbi:unnamed protein product [Arctogadus glacialis]